MISFNWPLIGLTSLFLYLGIIITLPFNPLTATILLLSLIAFWSKLPGGCIMEPLPILYVMDFVDVFSVMIAIFVGPFQGAAFALIWNIYPRLCGAFRPWLIFFKDGAVQAFICLFMPFIHAILGHNILLSITAFSIIRIPLYLLLCYILPHRNFIEQIYQTSVAATAVVLVNVLYTKLFGGFFVSLLQEGASFSWTLFFVASGIILLFSILIYGFSPKEASKKVGRNIMNIVKHRIKNKTRKDINGSEDTEYMRQIRDQIERK